jgi:hypothetical protein
LRALVPGWGVDLAQDAAQLTVQRARVNAALGLVVG